jgi:deoxyribodipyrimidine photo-lyase
MKNLVWFKKDLRVNDHGPLYEASFGDEVIALYILEPEWVDSYEFSLSHYQFLKESLIELERKLSEFNIPLILRYGQAHEVFQNLHLQWKFEKVFAHQETGADWSYQRDLKSISWFKNQSIEFTEFQQFAVHRKIKSRNQWNELRKKTIERKLIPHPMAKGTFEIILKSDPWPELQAKNEDQRLKPFLQKGGIYQAHHTLDSFLNERSPLYLQNISNPLGASRHGSRISPYLSFGNISMTEIHHLLNQKKRNLTDPLWKKSLWAFDGMREMDFNESYFQAWCRGETGIPMIDAAMRCLHQTGWINFRMRAMLVSFAAYHLWLHWERPAQYLAQHFLDFEPGIHFSQFQMQSGVTGINTIRIYSPVKQAEDQDVDGGFIHQYVPELKGLQAPYLYDPQTLPPLLQMESGCVLGRDYPYPILDLKRAYSHAKQKIYDWKKNPEVRQAARMVLDKHGSRKNSHFPTQKRND